MCFLDSLFGDEGVVNMRGVPLSIVSNVRYLILGTERMRGRIQGYCGARIAGYGAGRLPNTRSLLRTDTIHPSAYARLCLV